MREGHLSLWRNQSFLRLWTAQAVSNAGSKVTEVALPLTAVLTLGATPAQMGLLSIAGSLPNLLIGLPRACGWIPIRAQQNIWHKRGRASMN